MNTEDAHMVEMSLVNNVKMSMSDYVVFLCLCKGVPHRRSLNNYSPTASVLCSSLFLLSPSLLCPFFSLFCFTVFFFFSFLCYATFFFSDLSQLFINSWKRQWNRSQWFICKKRLLFFSHDNIQNISLKLLRIDQTNIFFTQKAIIVNSIQDDWSKV